MSLTTAGLTDSGFGPGVTRHYSFSDDNALSHADGQVATNGLIAGCEADFALMQGWFDGINIPFDYPLGVQVTSTADFARGTQGSPATGGVPRVFAGTAGVLRIAAFGFGPRPECAQHHATGRIDRRGQGADSDRPFWQI
jgi:hypothetical protein